MSLGILLRNEWTKARHWRAFRVPVLLFAVLMGLNFGGAFFTARNQGRLPPALPEAWTYILGGSQATLFFVAVVLIPLIASEFTQRTARQNIIDGLSKEEWFIAKLMVLPLTALLFILLQVGIGSGFALAGTDFSTASGPWIGRADLAALGGVLLAVLGSSSLAFMLAFLVRNSGPAIALFFVYAVAVESLLKELLPRVKALAGIAPHLPITVFLKLLSRVQFDPAAAARAVEAALKAGRPAPTIPGTSFLVALAIAYIALFVGVAFVTYRRRDL
jgi:ABC-type transport system involved in multi-copper enzyme maturation permease subunit